jgi:thioredoxin-dependent peroxiredoxin
MDTNELKEGMKAPNFTLIGSDDLEHSLSDYLGKNVILFFYSKDNTAG